LGKEEKKIAKRRDLEYLIYFNSENLTNLLNFFGLFVTADKKNISSKIIDLVYLGLPFSCRDYFWINFGRA
jgi:hypothetical protein